MAEKINGWTISRNNGMWQAVNKEGTIGMAKEDKGTVVRFAQTTNAQNYGKR